MSKKNYSPLSVSELLANHEATTIARQKPQGPQLNAVQARSSASGPSFSEQQLELYTQLNGGHNINYNEVAKLKVEDYITPEQVEKIEYTVNKLPDVIPEQKKELRSAMTKEALIEKEKKEEASLPPMYHEVKEELKDKPEKLEPYKQALKKRREILSKSTRHDVNMQAAIAHGNFTMGALTSDLIAGVASMLPDSWGLNDEQEKELEEVTKKIYEVQAPIVENKRAVANDELQYFNDKLNEELAKEDVDRHEVMKWKYASTMKERELEEHDEYLTDAGFWRKFEAHGKNIATIGLAELVETGLIVLPAALKGQDDPESLSESDKMVLKAFQDHSNAVSDYGETANWRARLGNGLGHSGPLLTGMMVTGGTGNVVKAGVSQGVKAGIKGAAGRTLGNILGATAKIGAQSAMMPMTYNQTSKNLIGVIEYDADRKKILMNDQIYKDFENQINGPGGQRDKLGEFVKSLNAKVTLDGMQLSPEQDRMYQEARARLGLSSTANVQSFDELLKDVEATYPERMGAVRAITHGFGSTAAEVFAEQYLGKYFTRAMGKLAPAISKSKLGRKYMRLERKIATALPVHKASGGLIGGLPEEMFEELAVSPLHAVNDWSTAPLTEWYDPEKGLNTKHIMDIGIQTLAMGGAFRIGGGAMNMVNYITDKEAYKKQKANRQEAERLFREIKYAGDESELQALLDVGESNGIYDIKEKKRTVALLRAKDTDEDNKKADAIEKKMFSNMLRTALRTGTLDQFESSLKRQAMNQDLSEKTRLNVLKIRNVLSDVQDIRTKFKGAINSNALLERELTARLGEEDLVELDGHLTKAEDKARKEFEEMVSNDPELEGISFSDIGGGQIAEDKAKRIESSIKDNNFDDLMNYLGLSLAKSNTEKMISENRQQNRKESSKEFQHILKAKAHFSQSFQKALHAQLKKDKIDSLDLLTDTHVENARAKAEKKIPKRYKNVQLTEQDKATIIKKYKDHAELVRQMRNAQIHEENVKEAQERQKNDITNEDPATLVPPVDTPESPDTVDEPQLTPEQEDAMKAAATASMNTMGEIVQDDGGNDLYENVPEGIIDDLDFPQELPEGSDRVDLKVAAPATKELYDGFVDVYGRPPSFQELIKQVIKYQGKETARSIYVAYAMGWEANNYSEIDPDAIYDEIFNPLQRLVNDNVSRVQDMMGAGPSVEEVNESNEETKEEIIKEESDIITTDSNNEPVYGKGKKAKGFKTTSPKSKAGFNSIEYKTIVDETTGTTKRVAVNTSQLKESKFLDVRELLHPDKFKAGDEANVQLFDESTWDHIPTVIGYNENNEAITVPFSQWFNENKSKYEKENPGKDFKESQEFINKAPIAIVGSEGQAVAMVHDINWYNHVNVGRSNYLTPEEALEDSNVIALIKEGRENTIAIRNKILREGKNTIVITEKTSGVYNELGEGEDAISVTESDPNAIIAVQRGEKLETTRGNIFGENSNKVLLNDPEKFKIPRDDGKDGNKSDGHAWIIFRVGTDKEGRETYRAFKALRKDENNQHGIYSENLETLRWLYSAQARLKHIEGNEDSNKKSFYEKYVGDSDYTMSMEQAQAIREEIIELTGMDLQSPKQAADLMKVFGVYGKNTDLKSYGQNLFNMAIKNTAYSHNIDLDFLGSGKKMFQINNKEVVPYNGDYNKLLADQLSTNIRGVNIGTEDNPVHTVHPQPSVYFEVKDEVSEDSTELKQKISNPVTDSQVTDTTQTDETTETDETVDTTEQDNEKISNYVINIRKFLTGDLQIPYDENILGDLDSHQLPNEIDDLTPLQNILNITANLNVKQEGQIVDYLFNKLLISIDAKQGERVQLDELFKELSNSFDALIEGHLSETENIITELEKIIKAYPDNKEARVALANANKALTLFDSIQNNWDAIQRKAVDKVTKYTQIREVNESQSKEDDTTEREGNWNASSLEEGSKAKTSYQLKRFMSGIPLLNDNNEQKRGFLGVPLHVNFDEVYNSIAQFYAGNIDVPADFKEMLKILKPIGDTVPWVNALVEKLEKADTQIQNQFAVTYTRHSLSMKFAMYDKSKDGNVSLKVFDTNSHEISRVLIDQWKQNMSLAGVIKNGIIDKTAAKELQNKYRSLGNNKHLMDESDLRDFLDGFGIRLSNQTWDELKAGRYYNGRLISYEGLFNDASGIFRLMDEALSRVENMSDEHLNTELFPEHHPFTHINNALKALAKMEANHTANGITLTFRDGGKLINSQVPPKFATDRISDFKRKESGMNLVKQFLALPISSQNTFLQLLETNPDFRDKFGVSHLGLQAFKEMGKAGNPNFTGINDINDIDHDYVKLTFLQDMQQGTVRTKGGIPMRMAKLFFPTMSDKDQMLLLNTAVFDFANNSELLFEEGAQENVVLGIMVKKLLYDKLVLPELKRIIDFHTRMGGESNIKGYDDAAQMFNFIPELNNVKNEKGIRAISQIASWAKEGMSAEDILNNIEGLYKGKFKTVAEGFIHAEAKARKEEWEGGILQSINGEYTHVGFNKAYMDAMGKKSLTEVANIGVYDMVINSVLGNADMFTGIAGDPALFAKDISSKTGPVYNQADEFYSQQMETFGVNIGKRLALLLAPGVKLSNSRNEKYKQLFLSDAVDVSENIEYLITLFHGDKALTEDVKNMIANINEGDNRKKLQKKFTDIANYFELESTDAQEYTTVKEHVNILNRQGKLTPAEYRSIMDALDEGLSIPKEVYGKVLQPIKPVYAGQIIENGVARTMYIKSSSFPLLKELTAGTKLDALRVKMEEIEEKTKEGVRASYQSANKVGALKETIDITNPNSIATAEESMLTLSRDNFKIQQDVPFKSDKKGRDTISMGTQIFKLLMGDGMVTETGFMVDGREYDGKELVKAYNENFGVLVKAKKEELFDELGLNPEGKPIDKKYTAVKLQELLKEEAVKRNYPLQDIKNLTIEEKTHKGEKYYEFITPLWLSTNSVRFESMLNSIVTNRLLQHKMPGFSGVAASEHGMSFTEDFNEIEKHKSRIIYLDGWNGKELQATKSYTKDDKVHFSKAQVFAPSKFKNAKGELIDLFEGYSAEVGQGKYIIKKDGKLLLKRKKIDKDMLNLFSFRTPTSSHVSGSSIEIVGILPPESGDIMMVPKNFTQQKGLDYDVDKENNYMLNHVIAPNGKIEVLKQKHKTKALASLEEAKGRMKGAEGLSVDERAELKENLINDLGYTEEDAEKFVSGKDGIQKKIERVTRAYDKKLAENRFIKIHLAVYNNPATGVQKKINKILSMDFAKSQAEFIDNLNNKNTDKKNFSILSDSYQRKKMGLGAAGKLAIGVYSNFVTAHGLVQQNEKRMYVQGKNGPVSFIFGKHYLKEMTFGRQMTLDGSRSVAEVFAEKQNTATDNEKEQVLGRVGVNGLTINVDAYMTLLGFDKETFKDEDGKEVEISLPYALLSQPIIKDYVKMMQEGRGITSDFDKNLKQKTINALLEKYHENGKAMKMNEIGLLSSKDDYRPNLTGANMVDAMKANTPNQNVQVGALQAFLELDMRAKQFAGTISLVNTNDLGLSILETSHTYNKLANFGIPENKYLPGSAAIANAESLIGEFQNRIPEGEDAKDWIKVGNRFIKPQTAQGHLMVNGVHVGNTLWEDYFPYTDTTIQTIISQVQDIGNIDLEKDYKVNEENQQIVADIKKYIFSMKSNGIFNQLASEERERLFMDREGKNSLATYMMNTLRGGDAAAEILKQNKLINKFTFDPQFDGRPSLIKFNNVDKSTFDEDYLYTALTEMILEDKPLPAFNGAEYSTKKLAQDLITYAYVEGGTQQAIQFIKYVPVEYLQSVAVLRKAGQEVKKINVNEVLQTYNAKKNPQIFENIFGSVSLETLPFVTQYFQHHPEKLPQVDFKTRMLNPKRHGKDIVAFDYKLGENEKLEDIPPMVSMKMPTKSKKKQDKWAVFKKVSNSGFVRIDVLGSHGMNEFEFKAPSKQENAKSVIGPAPTMEVQRKMQASVISTPKIPFNIKEGDTVQSVMDKLAMGNMKKYGHIAQMAQYLKGFVNPHTTLTFDTSLSARGEHKFDAADETNSHIVLNPEKFTDEDSMARAFFHEFIHSVTTSELLKYYDGAGNRLRGQDGNLIPLPKHVERLNIVFSEFKKQYTPDQINAFKAKRKARMEGKNVVFSKYEIEQIYPATNIFEFVTGMMTEPELIKKMKTVPYKKTNQTIFQRFGQVIADLIKSIHPDGKNQPNLADEAIASTLELIRKQHERMNPGKIVPPSYLDDVSKDQGDIDYPTLDELFGSSVPPNEIVVEEGSIYDVMPEGLDDFGDIDPLEGIEEENDGESDAQLLLDEVPENIQEVYYTNPDLADIGSIEEYSDYLKGIFPDSVVNEVLYHGSNNKIERFSKEKLGLNTNSPSASQGFYFTNEKANAMNYTLQHHIGGLLDKAKYEFSQDNEMYYNEVYMPVLTAFNRAYDQREKIGKKLEGLKQEQADKKLWEKLVEELKAIAAKLSGKEFASTKQLINELSTQLEKLSYAEQKKKLDEVAAVMKEKNMRMINYDAALKAVKFDEIEALFDKIKSTPESYSVRNSEGKNVPASEMRIYPVLVDSKKPLRYDDGGDRGGLSYYERIKQVKNEDSVIFENSNDPFPADIYVMFEPSQIHILGSKNDINGFKSYKETVTFTGNDLDNLPDCI